MILNPRLWDPCLSQNPHFLTVQLMHHVGLHQSCHVMKPNAMWLMRADVMCHKATYQITNLKEKKTNFLFSKAKLTKQHIFLKRWTTFRHWGIFSKYFSHREVLHPDQKVPIHTPCSLRGTVKTRGDDEPRSSQHYFHCWGWSWKI